MPCSHVHVRDDCRFPFTHKKRPLPPQDNTHFQQAFCTQLPFILLLATLLPHHRRLGRGYPFTTMRRFANWWSSLRAADQTSQSPQNSTVSAPKAELTGKTIKRHKGGDIFSIGESRYIAPRPDRVGFCIPSSPSPRHWPGTPMSEMEARALTNCG